MKTSKLVLDYDFDFGVIGIISHIKEFKLAWYLNQYLQVDFTSAPEHVCEYMNGSKLLFSNFLFETENSTFRLLNNKSCEFYNSNKPYLIPELKKFDYLLQFSDTFQASGIKEKVLQVPVVLYCENIDITHLKSKHNLIF